MSLHINLLKEEERANPSGKILQTTLITAAAVIGIGLGLYVMQTFFMTQASQNALSRAQKRSEEMKQNHKLALSLIADIAEAKEYLNEMAAFSNAQINVSSRLYAIAVSIPPEIQVTQLTIDNQLVSAGIKNDIPARKYIGNIAGRTPGNNVEARLRHTISDMNQADGLLGNVTPGGILVDPAKPSERTFEIKFALDPRGYTLPAPEAKEAKKK